MTIIENINPISKALFKLFLCGCLFTFCIIFGWKITYIPFPITIFVTLIITLIFAYRVFEIGIQKQE